MLPSNSLCIPCVAVMQNISRLSGMGGNLPCARCSTLMQVTKCFRCMQGICCRALLLGAMAATIISLNEKLTPSRAAKSCPVLGAMPLHSGLALGSATAVRLWLPTHTNSQMMRRRRMSPPCAAAYSARTPIPLIPVMRQATTPPSRWTTCLTSQPGRAPLQTMSMQAFLSIQIM